MTNSQMHPSMRRRMEEVKSDRERRYSAVRCKITEDLKRTIGALTTANKKAKLDLVDEYIDMARLLYATVEKTPSQSPLSGMVRVGAQHLQNGMVLLNYLLQRSVNNTEEPPKYNAPCEDDLPQAHIEFMRQEKILREQIVSFLRAAN